MRHHRWLGHILRLAPDNITFHALNVHHQLQAEGNLLMDVAPYTSIEDLARQAMDRARWRELTHVIR